MALDGSVAVSARRFDDAVRSFCERRPVWHAGVARWEPALYTRIRGQLTARTPGRAVGAGSRAPLRLAVLDWLSRVDRDISRWGPGAGTVDTLRGLAARTWRPQDCGRLDDYSDQLAAWATEAAHLLGDAITVVPLRNTPCPACHNLWAIRHCDDGAHRAPALTVSEDGAECRACHAQWTVEQFDWLAKLLTS